MRVFWGLKLGLGFRLFFFGGGGGLSWNHGGFYGVQTVFLNACLDLLQGSALSGPKLESGGWEFNEFARCLTQVFVLIREFLIIGLFHPKAACTSIEYTIYNLSSKVAIHR